MWKWFIDIVALSNHYALYRWKERDFYTILLGVHNHPPDLFQNPSLKTWKAYKEPQGFDVFPGYERSHVEDETYMEPIENLFSVLIVENEIPRAEPAEAGDGWRQDGFQAQSVRRSSSPCSR